MTGMWHHVGAGCGEGRCGGHGRHAGWSEERYHAGGDGGGGLGAAFGVRRPLRFLAWKLELDEAQVTGLAAILNELKTERAQAAVDDRRALTALADAVAGETFDAEAAGRFALVAAALSRTGAPIGVADTLIAAQALALGLTLVSSNTPHFKRVSGLKLENWL